VTSALIIDDHPFALQVCRRLLADAGIAPLLDSDDLENGYKLYQWNRPAVVMVDLARDRRAGPSLLRRMRAHDVATCVIGFTMHDAPTACERFRRAMV
jgi:DNA-binding NarL/FixJ family response regulator